ncbi:MAG: 16S rRNA (uracil(1498)-N(3))-methyltransferase [Buchananella hordeovulneris]|nr:16S rRNA (uracil(1498)-N(3))-methyltransferase [Buchananella hordeovulneris]
MSLPVFVVSPAEFAAAEGGARIDFTGAEAQHAAAVRRIRVGERVDVVDGAGGRARGAVTDVSKQRVSVEVEEWGREAASSPQLVLVQALAKGGRDEQALETATELGISRALPWQAQRSVAVWSGPKIPKAVARWEAIALAAAKQSRRSWVPAVDQPRSTRELCKWIQAVTSQGWLVALMHEEATAALTELPVAGDCPGVALVVGPEGGIGEEETAALVTAGAHLVRLGPHVLRTSSAGPAGLAVLATRLNLWSARGQ